MSVRWGMIGCGNVAEVKSGPSLSLAKNSSLQMIMSISSGEAESFAERHKVPNWTTDPEKLINSPEVTAVYIATPPDSHLEYTKMAAAAGKPVLTEKPMACTLKDAEIMAETCLTAGVPLFVAYYRRGLQRYQVIKEIIKGGRIGLPRAFSIRHTLRPENHPVAPVTATNTAEGLIPWRFLPEINGGGNFVDMGTHMIDMIDFLLTPFTRADGFAQNVARLYPAEDIVSGSFTLENNVEGIGLWCYDAGVNIDRTEIIGSKGRIIYSCFNNDPVLIEIGDNQEKIYHPIPDHTHLSLIQSIVNDLMGNEPCVSTYKNGLRAMHIQERLLAKFYGRSIPL